MTRKGWNGKDMWIALQIPTPSSKMGAPYLYMSMVDGTFVPWLASQTDLMAVDWEIAAPNGGVNCACDAEGTEENIVDKFEEQIAMMVVDGLKKECPGRSFTVAVDVKIDKK